MAPAPPNPRGLFAFLRRLFQRAQAPAPAPRSDAETAASHAAGFAMSGTAPMAAAAAAFYSLPKDQQTSENARAIGFAAGLGGSHSSGG